MNMKIWIQIVIPFFISFINVLVMTENQSPRKNLWKNLNREKNKYSATQQINSNYGYNFSNSSAHNSSGLNIQDDVKSSNTLDKLQLSDQNFHKQNNYFPQNDKAQKSLFFSNDSKQHERNKKYYNMDEIYQQINESNKKNRKDSIGNQSIVQQIIDIKGNQNQNLYLDEEDQQPMILSLGSHSNPTIKEFKLSKAKQQIEKLQLYRLDLLKYMKSQKLNFSAYIQNNIQNIVSYLIEFYGQKLDQMQRQLQYNEKEKAYQQQVVTPSTARFNKKDSVEGQQIKKIQELQFEVFRLKAENQSLQSTLEQLRVQNQQINQFIFDCEQKQAQIQLVIKERVEQQINRKLKGRDKVLVQAEKDRKFYLQQLQALQKELQAFETDKNMKQELDERLQLIINKQNELIDKQKSLNQFQVYLNSQKLEIEQRIKSFQNKQLELKSLQALIDKRNSELIYRQRQINYGLQKSKQLDHREPARQHHYQNKLQEYPQLTLSSKLKSLSNQNQNQVYTKFRNNYDDPESRFSKLQNYKQQTKTWRPTEQPRIESKLRRKATDQFQQNRQRNGSGQKQRFTGSRMGTAYTNVGKMNGKSYQQTKSQSTAYQYSKSRQKDKTKLQDLGTILQNLRNQIQKQIEQTE